MLDIHSHILPKFDDGSKSLEMSLEMLRSSKEQGISTMVSTSHFYADSESPSHFLRRRRHAAEILESHLTDSMPRVLYGAEVLYYPGISHSDEIPTLAIEGTSLILIELPFIPWTEKIFDELMSFRYHSGLHIVLAHVERYQALQKRAIYESLFDYPFLFQCNAEAFSSLRSRRLALSLIERGLLHFLGTDCHNITSRPPNMYQAQQTVEKKLSKSAWDDLMNEAVDRFNSYTL